MKHSILDIPIERSSHVAPTPRGGGISFVIAFYLGLTFMQLTGQIERDLFLALLPGIGLAIIGIVDDFASLRPFIKLISHFICSGIALYFLGGFQIFTDSNQIWVVAIVTLIGIVWFINLFNFMDGSDGYASMEAITVAFAIWFFTRDNVVLLLVFAIVGFIYWNLPRAKIFMGDAGSTTLGFILVILGIHFHNIDTFNFSFWILITALFWFDATIILIRRIVNQEKLSIAHKNHTYQRAILGGFSHLRILLLGLVINLILFSICTLIWKELIPQLLGFVIGLLILCAAMVYVERLYGFKK